MRRAALVALLLLAPVLVQAQALMGVARALGPDSVSIDGASYQLWGIDAPEINQPCSVAGVLWECGPSAARKLAELLELRPVSCEARIDRDRTRRTLRFALCRNGAGEDVALEMVKAGMAYALRAQTLDYAAAEDRARADGVGIFRGTSMPPWEFRDAQRN